MTIWMKSFVKTPWEDVNKNIGTNYEFVRNISNPYRKIRDDHPGYETDQVGSPHISPLKAVHVSHAVRSCATPPNNNSLAPGIAGMLSGPVQSGS